MMRTLKEFEEKIDQIAERKKKEASEKTRHSELVGGLNAIKEGVETLAKTIDEQPEKQITVKAEIDAVEVKNWPELKEIIIPPIPEFPKEVKISNFPPERKQPEKFNVEVKNWPTKEKPTDYKNYWTKLFKGVAELPKDIAEKIRQVVQPVEITNQDPLKVVLVDEEGRKYKATGGGGFVQVSGAGSPIGLRDSVSTGQVKIAVTGTAVRLPDVLCKNGVLIRNGGTTNIIIGNADVANTADGTGNGMVLGAKETTSAAVTNLNQIYINGTANTSWISYLVS